MTTVLMAMAAISGMAPVRASQLETTHSVKHPMANAMVGQAISGECRRATWASNLIVDVTSGSPHRAMCRVPAFSSPLPWVFER
jgi:hypothetical protein